MAEADQHEVGAQEAVMLKLFVIPALILLPSAIGARAADRCSPMAAAQNASLEARKAWFRCAMDDILQDPAEARAGQSSVSSSTFRADNAVQAPDAAAQ